MPNLPDLRLEISCSAGTYIRTLGADIGSLLGCGGYLKTLRRIECSRFRIEESLPMDKIRELIALGKLSDHALDMAAALRGMPEFSADPLLIEKIRKGVVLSLKDVKLHQNIKSNGYVKIVDQHKNLICVLDVNKKCNRLSYCCVFS